MEEAPLDSTSNNSPHGFQLNSSDGEEETKLTMMDLTMLADAAAKSPVRDDNEEGEGLLPVPPAGIPIPDIPMDTTTTEETIAKNKQESDDYSKKPAAAKAGKTKAKAPTPAKRTSTRARKLPTKLKEESVTPPPSKMTSSSSAMSAAAILVQVSGGAEKPKKKSKPRKPKAPKTPKTPAATAAATDVSDIRGITMKRPGKWQAQFYYAGQSRYIGIFTSQQKAAQAYEIVRKMLKDSSKPPASTPRESFEVSRRAAYEAVGEPYPDGPEKKLTPLTVPAKRKRSSKK